MEHENYEVNIESWAHSIIEMEENTRDSSHIWREVPPVRENSSLVSTMPTYYRSKAFSSHFGINNLINAADPLITLATKLRKVTVQPDTTILFQNICHEVKAFENKAQTLDYRPPIILAARFVICALLDELITLTLWPDVDWNKFSLVETFHKDSWEGDRFFILLERSLQDAAGNIELLELIYLCLRLGYEGKYREIERGHFELRAITEHLYSVITQFREEYSRGLLVSIDNQQYYTKGKKHYSHLLPPVWIISTVMILSLLIIFTFFYIKLSEASTPIAQLLNSLQQTKEVEATALPAKQ